MINELNLGEEDKGFNLIKKEGSFLGIIEEDHADEESQMSDRGHHTELTRQDYSMTHLSVTKDIPSEILSSMENTDADLISSNDKVTSQINSFL